MPDVFVAPDEKDTSIRNRAPAPQDTSIQLPENKNQPAPSQQNEPSASSPKPESLSQEQQEPEKNQSETPFSIERRNGIMPIFTSFWQNPRSVYFDTQEPNEHIFLFLRRHFITNTAWITFTVLLLIIPPIAFYLLQSIHYPLTFFPLPLLASIIVMYYLFVLTNAFINFLDWYYNITIITSKRVMDIALKDLVNKKVAATKIDLIQDVDFKQVGTIPSLFNYGDVIMQTAGKEINFVAESVPNPQFVVQVVEDLIGKEEEPNTN
jgi:hypothetical protein